MDDLNEISGNFPINRQNQSQITLGANCKVGKIERNGQTRENFVSERALMEEGVQGEQGPMTADVNTA